MAGRIGIELLPHACRVVEVAPRARLFGGGPPERPRVRAFCEIPCSPADPDSFSAELRQALKGLSRRASVAVWGLRSVHQALLLPPAAPADLEVIARREARTTPGGLPTPPLADTVVAGALRDGRRETGYAAVSEEELRARIQPLAAAGVKFDAVTTPALAHALLARQRRALLPDAVVAVLSVNAHATAITVVHGGVVLFAREMPWGDQSGLGDGEEGAAGRVAFASRVAAELRRSLVYVRQTQRVEVSRVFVCGDMFDLRVLTAPLMNEIELDVETLDVDDDLDLSRLAEPSDAFRSRLGSWRTALALAADPSPQPGLRSRDEHRPAVSAALVPRVAAAAMAGALIVAAGWGVLGYLQADVAARQERLRRTIGVLEPELQRREDERRRIALANARQAALDAFASQGPRLARVMEVLSLAAPPEVALSAIRVEPGVASWHVVVEGQAEGPDAAAAHAVFNRFLEAAGASPLLGRPSAPPAFHAVTKDPEEAAGERPLAAPPEAAAVAVEAVSTPRPGAAGPAYIEVARDGRLYRIPLRRQSGDLETSRRAEETRRLQQEALASRTTMPVPASGAAATSQAVRHAASVVEFTLRYEVAK